MTWSTKLATFVADSRRPEFREPAMQVIRELDKFANPEAINGIAPLNASGAVGIGINHQRKKWFLLGALLFFGLLGWFSWSLGPGGVRLSVRDAGSNDCHLRRYQSDQEHHRQLQRL